MRSTNEARKREAKRAGAGEIFRLKRAKYSPQRHRDAEKRPGRRVSLKGSGVLRAAVLVWATKKPNPEGAEKSREREDPEEGQVGSGSEISHFVQIWCG
jgi:hypothetical protein